MQNFIFTYYDKNGEPGVGLGNGALMRQTQKTVKQLIDYICIEQTEEQFEECLRMHEQELLVALNKFRDKNPLYLFNPS